jgi:uncharacterized Zn finger protein
MKSKFQEQQIRERATSQSFSRGESYYENGAIFDTVRRGNEIEGRCEGSAAEPYYVNVTLDDNGNIAGAWCTCEYSFEGDCKHIVALLLTYAREPQLFEEFAPVQDTLQERSKEELITLIHKMVGRYPDLKNLVDRPVVRATSKVEPVDVTPYQRELRRAISNFNHRGDSSAERAIEFAADAAHDFANAGQWKNAGAIYRTILEEFVGQGDYPADDEGELMWALHSVVAAVVACLEQTEISADDHERRALIEQLTAAYIWNIELGGYGLGDGILPDAILQHIRPEDIPDIRARAQAAQKRKQQNDFGRWGVEALERFQIELDALDSTDPEETLQRLREQGLYRLVFEKLISMGRIDEAIQVVSQHVTNSYERLLALPRLEEVGRSADAVRLANESLRAGFDYHMANWLDHHYQTSGSRNDLFELRLLCMQQQSSVGHYVALKEAAEAIDVWARVRPDILKDLEQKKEYAVLAQIYLHDEEWDAAWEMVDHIAAESRTRRDAWGWGWVGQPGIDLEVADKSKEARPHKALPVFSKYARRQIEGRSRGHYHQAAAYLSVVRDLYQKIGDENSWRELIQGIREEFRRLRALQDELNQAGL